MKIIKTMLMSIILLTFFTIPVLAVEAPPESVKLINPIKGTAAKPEGTLDVKIIAGNAIKQFTGILGSLALLMFVYGGFLWLTSAGNSEQVKKGTGAMLWSAIGIVIIFSSYAILTLVFKALSGA